MKNLFLFESGGRQNFGAEAMIIHNAWTERAREPVKKHQWIRETARNPMNVTKIYLYIWKFWEKFIFVKFPD